MINVTRRFFNTLAIINMSDGPKGYDRYIPFKIVVIYKYIVYCLMSVVCWIACKAFSVFKDENLFFKMTFQHCLT